MTVQDAVLAPALRFAGVTGAPRRTPSPDQFAEALDTLNRMLEAWSTERLLVYVLRADRYPMSPPQSFYTLGPTGADWTAPRPVRIESAATILQSGGAEVRVPLRRMWDTEWQLLRVQLITSTIPSKFYVERSVPNMRIHLWGIPTQSNPIEIFTWQPFDTFADPSVEISLPPGYAEAVVLNLAVAIADQYGLDMRPSLVSRAIQAKGRLKAFNARGPHISTADYAQAGGGDFNYVSGSIP